MKQLYTIEEFDNAKTRDLFPLECQQCGAIFYVTKSRINQTSTSIKRLKNLYCSAKCFGKSRVGKIIVTCDWCGKTKEKYKNQIAKTKHNFCTHSCAAHYSNSHKKHGSRRSKLECWLESKLINKYPEIEIHFNRVDAINSELDIYVPSLNIAFELNGIFHYEPIFGDEKLKNILNNDQRKLQACMEKGIELCIIDSSGLKYFKIDKAEKYLKIITDLIEYKTQFIQVGKAS